jgi:hypothetical protein
MGLTLGLILAGVVIALLCAGGVAFLGFWLLAA